MRIFALTAVEAGYDLIRALDNRGVRFDGIIALSGNRSRENAAGFVSAQDVGDLPATRIIEVDDYRLLRPEDRKKLEDEEIDILVVGGWQRLVPEWLIRHCRKGVIGLHGSARGISVGRGRSPQNWALLTGAPEFELAAFQIDPGVDSGPVLAVRQFPYTPHDDIASSYLKSILMGAQMISDITADWDRAVADSRKQVEEQAEYLPQRRAEDGAIDWRQSMDHIRRQVAAQTRPYPGAFTTVEGRRLGVWQARPIGDLPMNPPGECGEIVHRAGPDVFVVRASDGYLVVDDFECDPEDFLKVGMILPSVPFADTVRSIVERHRSTYPDQPLSRDVTDIAEGTA